MIFLVPNLCYSKKPLQVTYRYPATAKRPDSFALEIMKPNAMTILGESPAFEKRIIQFKKTNDASVTTCTYDIPDTSCGGMLDGFGHEIFLIPGDSFTVDLVPKSDDKVKEDMQQYGIYSEFELKFSGSNKFIYSLFDSLFLVAGDFRFKHTMMDEDRDFGKFFHAVEGDYNNRKTFVENYCARHSVPDRYKRMAMAEVYAAYYTDLIAPYFAEKNKGARLNNIAVNYSTALEGFHYNDEQLYFSTSLTSRSVYDYYKYTIGKNDSVNIDKTDAGLIRLYKKIKSDPRQRMRDDLLAHVLVWSASESYPSIDSLYNDFSLICKNAGYLKEVDEAVQKEKQRQIQKNAITLKSALKDSIISLDGTRKEVGEVLGKGKPVVIDCWASWCSPCVKEIPFSMNFKEKYKGKIEFVFLSFDKTKENWLKKAKELKVEKASYLLSRNFESDFALHFGISAIPRYIILDKTGRLITDNAARPSKERDFDSVLQQLIK